MNTSIYNRTSSGTVLSVAIAASLVLAGCATTPLSPQGSAEARTKLTRLQSDPTLATRAPVALKEAETAVQVAEQPLAARDDALGAHRVYMADRKVDIAIAQASTAYAEEQRAKLGEQRATARLDARTREADQANLKAEIAQGDADAARASAAVAAQSAALEAEELRRQIDVLNAEATDRGLVVTLGDVLFATGRADLKDAGTANLNKLVAFLNKYPDRTVLIEGHTDDVGSNDSNQALSQRRADAVKSYLMQQGIASQRLAANGKGEIQPLADNNTDTGRQQNRRVEVIIDNPPPAKASVPSQAGPASTAVLDGPR